ncbi:SGNH/GDSL hydrolase family protein [Desulfosporosinus hippei]|uniref:Lysophospholipase L1 n=1 Tax=Desulfosporosinus hippei DSM 8344 TaxID=1121419 RepID=A0A1G7YQ15_9FIRM|nr:SGNH/GDSL hydrolase family protein [Desulfosporosinus hippei]SDG98623.1 Lysophospholipase L1 [Desulfosporosinus hippei DSM 8344]
MKVVAIGDSITEGYPYTPQESWVTYLAQELQCEVINKGINGNLTQEMNARFEGDVLSNNPTYVIILGGTNDAYVKYPLENVTPHFSAMVKMSREHGIIPILGLPTPSLVADDEVFLRQYRGWLTDCAKINSLPLIDFYTPYSKRLEAGEEAKLFVDEVHPSLDGYRFMAEIAIHSLKPLK